MKDLSPETRKLLEMARSGNRLEPRRRLLLKTRFVVRVAAGSVLGLASPDVWAKTPGLFGPVVKGLAAVALVSSLGAGGYMGLNALRSGGAPRPPKVSVPSSAPVVWLVPGTLALARNPAAAPRSAESPSEIAGGSIADGLREIPSRHPGQNKSAPTTGARPSSRPARGPKSSNADATAQAGAPIATSLPTESSAAASLPASTESPPARIEDTAQPRTNTLSDEIRLLAEADQALRSGNANRALALLETHASTYPESALAPERSAERLLALCTLARVDSGTVRAYLNSRSTLLSARIRATCAGVLEKSR